MAQGRDEQANSVRRELFVRNIPSNVTSEELENFFSDASPVKHAVIVRDPETGESKNFGFVGFASAEDATAALKYAKSNLISGRYVQAEVAKPRLRKDETSPKVAAAPVEKRRPRLIIRNVPWSLRDPAELESIFSKYGKVVEAFIPRGANNRMSGFAFVTMRKKNQADLAIERSKDLEIHGRKVAVDMAVTKEKWQKAGQLPGAEESPEEVDDEAESDSEEREVLQEEEMETLNFEQAEQDGHSDINEGDSDEAEDEDESDNDDEEEEEQPRRRPVSDDLTVFIRNVPYSATSESLQDHFEEFGRVAYALPVMDKVLNQPKGTAFVAFKDKTSYDKCLESAPEVKTSSLLIPDDVDSRYVYDGRILSVAPAVHKNKADALAAKGAEERLGVLGKTPGKKDKRNLFLLNEGRVTSNSKLAEVIPASEMQIREKSFEQRKKQLNSNPSLHLSMTRLAIRNIPRSMDEKALKALGRKAVVEFAKEVTEKHRQPLSKEEVMRSVHHQDSLGEAAKSKFGVVRQAKVVLELKGSGEAGRSRGYGFLELRNHKAALMALRWLNGHLVTKDELGETSEIDGKRRLVVEFAVENAQVLKRQRDRQFRNKAFGVKRKAEEQEEREAAENAARIAEEKKPKGNVAIGRKRRTKKMRTH